MENIPVFGETVLLKLQKIINHAGGIILQNDVAFTVPEQLLNRDKSPRSIWQSVTEDHHSNLGVFAPFMHTYHYDVSIFAMEPEPDQDEKEVHLIAEYHINYEHHTMGSNGVCAVNVADIRLRITDEHIGADWIVRESHGDQSGAIARERMW
jgi:hypothetical protein